QAHKLASAVAGFKLDGNTTALQPAAPTAPSLAGSAMHVPAPAPSTGGTEAKPDAWDGSERRSPQRATNVSRLPARPATPPSASPAAAAAGGGADDEWESF
ncbi:MAG TPA: methyl-accepting chemotaxis protein, partial [Burkholderiaceae bacterium]|nr:methyl-accepting chemotaxis protein [Burkholderiaceae bacterium]